MGRIAKRFAVLRARGERALIPFIMAGDPDMARTRAFLLAAQDAGADLIELGVPFSDPTSDGPVLQRSAQRALTHNMSLPRVLEFVQELRGDGFELPLILFGYYNPIFRYGPERFARDAKAAGVDGMLVVDLPPEEAGELRRFTDPAGLDMIHLLAPNLRDLQVTTDLAGFWDRHYPAIRKELSRKYPRHSWPDDPRTAKPPEPKERR